MKRPYYTQGSSKLSQYPYQLTSVDVGPRASRIRVHGRYILLRKHRLDWRFEALSSSIQTSCNTRRKSRPHKHFTYSFAPLQSTIRQRHYLLVSGVVCFGICLAFVLVGFHARICIAYVLRHDTATALDIYPIIYLPYLIIFSCLSGDICLRQTEGWMAIN